MILQLIVLHPYIYYVEELPVSFLIYDYIIIMKKEAIKKGNTKYIVNIFLSCVPVWVFRLSSVLASRSGYYQSVNQQNVF